MRYFTSDLHFGSANINKYAKRPFADAVDALNKLVFNINDNLEARDTLIHVGDFMLSGADRHDKVHDTGLGYKLADYVGMLKPNALILLAGNHDDGHNCETTGRCMLIDLNHNWRGVTVGHYPSTNHNGYEGKFGGRWVRDKWNGGHGTMAWVKDKTPHIHLCGHVHDKWLVLYDAEQNVLNVNVGVDVWNYKPVRDAELTDLLDYIFHKSVNPFLFKKTWTMDRRSFDAVIENDRKLRAEAAEVRKAEKHIKKGLTPEECERRKLQAMKKKGLI